MHRSRDPAMTTTVIACLPRTLGQLVRVSKLPLPRIHAPQRAQCTNRHSPESFCLKGMKHSSGFDMTGRFRVLEIVTQTYSVVVTTFRGVLASSLVLPPVAAVSRDMLLPCAWLTRDIRREAARASGALITDKCDRDEPVAEADMDARSGAGRMFTTRMMEITTRTSPRVVNFPALLQHIIRQDHQHQPGFLYNRFLPHAPPHT
jgi:hypothetical protein